MAEVRHSNRSNGKTKEESSRPAVDRRDFLVKSAAMTLFGTLGLEVVMDVVLNRLKDIESTRELAQAIANQLESNGLTGRAMASALESYVCP